MRQRFEGAWGRLLPARPGLTVTELVDGALSGHIRALFILGENAAMTDPDLTHVHRCLRACEFLVVQEIFPSETARFAHVVLPAAASAEKAGTFTNTERRVQLLSPVVAPPGEARPDWWIIAELGRRLERLGLAPDLSAPRAGWHYTDPAAVMDEIASLTPIYGGISHGRLGLSGLQWPCPGPGHPGTPILHVGQVMRGRARFTPVRFAPAAETPDGTFPLILTTGRLLEHYHGGSMTRRVQGLRQLVPEALVEIHPDDMARLGVSDGEVVRLRSRRGEVTARAHVAPGIVPGTVFMPFHFVEAAANVLTHAALDPVAKIPEYKVCAVAVERA
jgi:predicted molibdopterin-dependent oxidoreductase YjgC